MSLEKDINFIKRAYELTSFDSVHSDWIVFNTKEAKNPDKSKPLYIRVHSKYGVDWGAMMQYNYNKKENYDYVTFSNGTNIDIIMRPDRKLFCNSQTVFELFYEEISREEFVEFYKELAYKKLKKEKLLDKM